MAKVDKRQYGDRRQYLIRAVHARRKKVRQKAVEYKGSKCQICGYDRCVEALEFHHKDLSKKDFGISEKGYTRSWKKVMEELDKCMMICANCHRELHAQLAASSGNAGVKSGLIQGNPALISYWKLVLGNPELPRTFLVFGYIYRVKNISE